MRYFYLTHTERNRNKLSLILASDYLGEVCALVHNHFLKNRSNGPVLIGLEEIVEE